MMLGTLGTSLLGNTLVGKGALTTRQDWGVIRAGKGTMWNTKYEISKF